MPTERVAVLLAGLMLAGCVQSTLEPAAETSLKPRDKQMLANAPYAKPTIPEPYRRHIVGYHRKEGPGTLVIDTDARYLYYVLPEGKAIRYGVTVGEEALAWSGVAKVGRMEEWPGWVPTADIKKRLGDIPDYVAPGPHNPMGARALYLYQGNKDTLFRVHGTNQPEYIGQAISDHSQWFRRRRHRHRCATVPDSHRVPATSSGPHHTDLWRISGTFIPCRTAPSTYRATQQNRLRPRLRGAKSYTVTARCPLPIASEPSSTVMQTLRESMPLDAKASGRVVTAQIVESTIRHAR